MAPGSSSGSRFIALLVPAAAACSAPGSSADLQVYGAASLKPALAAVRDAYEASHPGITLTVSTDSSAALEAKIEQGAPADVFLSADTSNAQKLVDGGLASGGVVTFAANQLTVIVPVANPAGITSPADLARPGVKVIACAAGVPIQKYTELLLDQLASAPGYPADFAAMVNANVVSREDNVGALAAKVSLGEGDAGIVYETDALAFDGLTTVPVPEASNVPASYGGVVVRSSRNVAAADAFLAWLAGPDGAAILATFGFRPAG